MSIVRELHHLDGEYRGCALTIGNFDGVHRGHQQIIAQAGLCAARARRPVIVLTFHPHPLEVLRPDQAPARLMTLEDKVQALRCAGADAVVLARSTAELLALTAEAFVEEVVVPRVAPATIVEGENFGFGRARAGTPELLTQLGARLGFAVCVVPPLALCVDDRAAVAVSSSLVRDLIRAGQVHRARMCLGRPYAVVGRVAHGAARGAELGFPTINLGHVSQLLPADGVYAGWGVVDEQRWPAAISVGTTPTFDGTGRQIEAHLLGCDEQLYESTARVEFAQWLRGQQRFADAQALSAQIGRDVEAVRRIASDAPESN